MIDSDVGAANDVDAADGITTNVDQNDVNQTVKLIMVMVLLILLLLLLLLLILLLI